jgi:hypothetical protein
MRQRFPLARGLALTAALVTASQSALAATPRHKKTSAQGTAELQKKKPAPEEPPPPAEEKPAPPAEAQPPPPVESTPARPPQAEPAGGKATEPGPASTTPAAEPASSEGAAPVSDEEAELGRREARRLAAGRILVAVWAGGGVANRRFTYHDAVGDNLAPYRLPAAPLATFGIEAYPAASSNLPILRDLGIRAHVSRGFAFDSNTPQGVTLETSWTRFGGELRERLLLPGAHAAELGLLVGADASYFGMTAAAYVPALLPAARTVALRFGFDARLRVAWRLSVLAGGAYLLTTSRGEIYEHFRHPSVRGVDADFGLAIDLGSGFEARLAGRYTRYFASFKPVLGDHYVAGGALDEQLQGGLGVRYAH